MKNEYKILKATKNYSVSGVGFAQMTEDKQFMATYKIIDKVNSLKISNKELKNYPSTLLEAATSYYVDPLFEQHSKGFDLDQVKKDGPENDNNENNNTQIIMN